MSNPVAAYNQKFPREEVKADDYQQRQKGDWGYQQAMELARGIIADGGFDVLGEKDHHGDHVFMLRHCVFDPSHTSNDAAILVSQSGMLKYKCFHNSCADKSWSDVRQLVRPLTNSHSHSLPLTNSHSSTVPLTTLQQNTLPLTNSQQNSLTVPQRTAPAPITEDVRAFIEQGSGIFNVFELDRELCLFTKTEKNARAFALKKFKKQGLIIPVSGQRGHWRIVDGNCRAMVLGGEKAEPLANVLPLGIHEHCDIRPGNLIVVAGSSNSGKSAFVINWVYSLLVNNIGTSDADACGKGVDVLAEMGRLMCQGQRPEIHFFSSEAGDDEMSSRLSLFPGGVEAFRDVYFWERDKDFADVVRPNAINVIDFLEVYDDFYQIGSWINDIHRVLDKGIAMIAIQKKRGADVGKGGDVTMEKPRLYINLENNAPYGGICKIMKAKFPKGDKNLNGLEIDYKLVNGHEFRLTSDWRCVQDERSRKAINKGYEADASEKGYMFNILTTDGVFHGINKKQVTDWTEGFPGVYVIGELMKIEAESNRKPFIDPKGWFFTVAGMLSKANSTVVKRTQLALN